MPFRIECKYKSRTESLKTRSMAIISRVIFLFELLKSTQAFFNDLMNAVGATEKKCILPDTWTEWVVDGSCGTVTRTRSYKYYMCEHFFFVNHSFLKYILQPELPASHGSVISRLESKMMNYLYQLVVS